MNVCSQMRDKKYENFMKGFRVCMEITERRGICLINIIKESWKRMNICGLQNESASDKGFVKRCGNEIYRKNVPVS